MKRMLCALWLVGALGCTALAQGLPTSQPNLLQIYREEVKVGHIEDHIKTEAGWPAAFEKANSPDFYLALASLTGPNEVWFVAPFESNAALGESMKRESDDPALSAELAALSRADAAHISDMRIIQAMARKDLSYGAFPDTSTQRFWEITMFSVRMGRVASFEAAARAWGAAAQRIAPDASYRVYQVVAGLPGTNFLIFSSFKSYGDLDSVTANDEKIMKGMTSEERYALETFAAEGIISTQTNRFRLDPVMSYVPGEVRKQDPEFWMSKKSEMMPPTAP